MSCLEGKYYLFINFLVGKFQNTGRKVPDTDYRLSTPPIRDMIYSCKEREASLVIEGSHVSPGMYTHCSDVEVLLEASPHIIERRLAKDKDRKMPENGLQRILEPQDHLIEVATEKRVPVIDTESIPGAYTRIIQLIPKGISLSTDFSGAGASSGPYSRG